MSRTWRSATAPTEQTSAPRAGTQPGLQGSNAQANEALTRSGPGASTRSLLDEVQPSTAQTPPEVDAHLATITSLILVTPTMSAAVLVDTARDLDARLRSGEIRGPRHRAAAAAKLLEIAAELQRRIDEAPLGPDAVPEVEGLEWSPGSPNVGLLEDITPFGAQDEWRTIAESAPPDPPSPRRRRRAPDPEAPETPAIPSPNRDGHQGAVDGHTWNAEHTGHSQGQHIGGELHRDVEEAGETAGLLGQAADVMGMMPVPFLDVAMTIVSYIAFVVGEHEQELARARQLGGRIAGVGLVTLSNIGDFVPNLSPRGLRRAAANGGVLPQGWYDLQVHCTQVPDRVLDQNIDDVLQRTSSEVSARLEVVERRAREQGLSYQERERVKQTYIRSVGAAIVERL